MHRGYIWGWACCWLININTYSILLIIRWAPQSLYVHKMLNTVIAEILNYDRYDGSVSDKSMSCLPEW